jgi:hypothetical protein
VRTTTLGFKQQDADTAIADAVERDRQLIAQAFAQFPWQLRGNARLRKGQLPQPLANAFESYVRHLRRISHGDVRWVYVVEDPWNDPHVHFRLLGLDLARYPLPRLGRMALSHGLSCFVAEAYQPELDTGYDMKCWIGSEWGGTNAWLRSKRPGAQKQRLWLRATTAASELRGASSFPLAAIP